MSSQVPFEPLPGSNGQPTQTVRHGDTILRPAGPWTPAVHALLRHLKRVGFPGSPRVVGDGYDDQGREVLTYIKGRIAHPRPTPTRRSSRSGGCCGPCTTPPPASGRRRRRPGSPGACAAGPRTR